MPELTKLTCLTFRPAKSGSVVSMPESTIAIAGMSLGVAYQSMLTPDSYAQSCRDEYLS